MTRFNSTRSSTLPSGRELVRERRGAMLVFVAVAMVVFFGFLALTLDVGAGNRLRRIAQTAADAGALAGAAEIYRLQSGDTILASARNEAIRNGFDAADITPNWGPATGPHAGDKKYVEVIITKNIPSIFGGIFNISSLNVRARAVAGVGSYALNCVVSLDPSSPQAVEVTNGGNLSTNCGVAVNSTNPNALDLNQSGQLDASGSAISVAGGWSGNKEPSPAPGTGTAGVPDPLSSLQMPTVGACTHTGLLTITTDTILNPGVFCGGILISSKTATLNPGTYITAGGGFTVGTSGAVKGTGVTLVNTIKTGFTFAPFNFGTGCKATLSAPTSGSLKGILMYQDPADPPNAVNIFSCSSDDTPELTGTLYFPTETLEFNGSNTTTQIVGSIVAYNLVVSGKVQIINDTSGGSGLQRYALVE